MLFRAVHSVYKFCIDSSLGVLCYFGITLLLQYTTLFGDEGLSEPVLAAYDGFGRHIGEFVESQESWSQYSERLEQSFLANSISNEKKALQCYWLQLAQLLSVHLGM